MRWVIVVGLVAASGCGSDERSKDPELAAGKITELTGSATATREGSEQRPLASGADVFADDKIELPTGSSLAIRLAHNNAEWRLEGAMTVRVDKSTAWKAPRESEAPLIAETDDPATTAAGRHSEKEAGEGAATAVANRNSGGGKGAAVADPSPSVEGSGRSKRTKGADVPAKTDKIGAADDVEMAAASPGDLEADGFKSDDLKQKASESSSISVIRGAISACYESKKGRVKGQIMATVTLNTKGIVTRVVTNAPKGLEAVEACIAETLKGEAIKDAEGQATSSVSFK